MSADGQDKSSVTGGAALIAGCCIGAGMLGLPIVARSSGFILSMIPLFIGWLYMYLSGLMLLEVYLSSSKKFNLMGLLNETLGSKGRVLGSGLFLFLFYSILTAYLNASTTLIQEVCNELFKTSLSFSFYLILNALTLFTFILLKIRTVDLINRVLLCCMLIFYICLVYKGLSQFKEISFEIPSNASKAIWAIPVFVLSFGFQNLIPTISHHLNGDAKRIKSAIFKGSVAAFTVYFIWNFIILGILSSHNQRDAEGDSYSLSKLFNLSTSQGSFFIRGFSFFALTTSILAVLLSFVDFISDSSEDKKNRPIYTACVIIPPTIFSLLNPHIFLTMLHIAGGVGAVSLFGLLPPIMLWKKRSLLKKPQKKIFPFGKIAIIFYLLSSIALLILELLNLTYGQL